MRKTILLLCLISFLGELNSQVFYTESFESTSGWTLSHTFDDMGNDFCKRDSLTNTAFAGLEFMISGGDGDFAIGAENTQSMEPGAPGDGVVILELDPVAITSLADLELQVSLACNANDKNYDDIEADNGDFVIFQHNIDNTGWVTIGEFNSTDSLSGDSELFYDIEMNGNGGEIGDLPLENSFKDFVMPIGAAGDMISIRALFRMTSETEEILIDNFRLKQSEGDVTPLEVFDAYRTSTTTIDVVFHEDVGANATNTFQYSGISNLATATIQPDGNTVTLEYSVPFVLGNGYTLVVFGVEDLAGNSMQGTHQYTFYYNDTEPELVITEIMYNDASGADSLEYIEVYNNGTAVAILGGLELEDGINFTFPTSTLAPGEFVLVARNAIAATAHYGLNFLDYGGSLSNNGEQIELVNAEGATIDSVRFDNDLPWPPGADGFGPSAELNSPDNDNALGANWVASTNGLDPLDDGSPVLGTPGALPGVIVPEVQFFENTIEALETAGSVEFMVSISGSNDSPSVIEFFEIGGTAISPLDLGASGLAPITFSPGSTDPQTVTIPIVNDILNEGVEFYRLGMNAVNNANIGIKDTLLIIIADDEFESPTLYINELQAANTTTIADEFEEFDDWFEIYNPNVFQVDVAGYYVSDDPLNLTKDRFAVDVPETVIGGGGWLLVWADEQGSQGPLHMNFRFSSAGEFIGLTAPDGTAVIDSLTFPPVTVDTSYGRQEDGDPTFVFFTNNMSPGASNNPDGIFEVPFSPLLVFPNPTSGIVNVSLEGKEIQGPIRIYNSQMQLTMLKEVSQHSTAVGIDVTDLQMGVYFLVVDRYLTKFVVE